MLGQSFERFLCFKLPGYFGSRLNLFFIRDFLMNDLIYPLLLCGGTGTRLWPLSRESYPKQFGQITGAQSLFQGAVHRLQDEAFAKPTIVTGNDFRFIVTEQLSDLGVTPQTIIIEPTGRNTAPAVLAAALVLAQKSSEALLLVTPSDHFIPDASAFRETVLMAAERARAGDFVAFGVMPTHAETGYGYLELATSGQVEASTPQPLARFIEKPDTQMAADLIANGNFLWNAGIFLFSAQSLIDAFQTHAPDILAPVRAAVSRAVPDLSFLRLDPVAWADVPNISFDYAIMEKVPNLAVIPLKSRWLDLSDWSAVWKAGTPDTNGNVISSHATAIGCSGSLLRSESPRMEIVGIGLEDIIAIATTDAVLVARKSETQLTKDAVSILKGQSVSQATEFPTDHRPWGMFESLIKGPRFQVKRIVVKPGAALSLQIHHHRSEHWIVVEGTAKVTIDDEVRMVSENQSVYIPIGSVHRMENPGKVPMVLIEVQTGSYLGEDDIIRYDDVYSRGQGAKG
jgi:mannose-1-phosphate guanylyltransferase / mannose-6-phosphate isomerase